MEAAWLADGPPVLRRAVYSSGEECGDEPAAEESRSYCAQLFPRQLFKNLRAMGLEPGLLELNRSGFVTTGFAPLLTAGRKYHNAMALQAYASPAQEALWKVLFALR